MATMLSGLACDGAAPRATTAAMTQAHRRKIIGKTPLGTRGLSLSPHTLPCRSGASALPQRLIGARRNGWLAGLSAISDVWRGLIDKGAARRARRNSDDL